MTLRFKLSDDIVLMGGVKTFDRGWTPNVKPQHDDPNHKETGVINIDGGRVLFRSTMNELIYAAAKNGGKKSLPAPTKGSVAGYPFGWMHSGKKG